MKAIKFKKNTNYNGKTYLIGSILDDFSDIKGIWRLNEKGFIEPLTLKEFKQIQKDIKNKKKEEEK